MSIDVMVSVWKHSKQKAAARLLLIAIADSANDHGEAWPGIKSLAKKCNTSDRNIQKLIKHLEASGELRVVDGGGRSTVNGATNKYIVITPDIPLPTSIEEARPVNAGTPVSNSTPVKELTKGGVPQYTGPVNAGTPNPKVNPKETAAITRETKGKTPPPLGPQQDESSAAWLKSLDYYPSQIASALSKHPVFTLEERSRCEAWIKRQNFAKAHVSLFKQFLSIGEIPDAPKTAAIDPNASAMTAERLKRDAEWMKKHAHEFAPFTC